MAALTDLSDIVNRATGGNSGSPEHIFTVKENRAGGVVVGSTTAGRMTSLWTNDGVYWPGGATPPTSPTACDNNTQGSLIYTQPGGTREKWLLGVTSVSSVVGTLFIYDRVAHRSGLSGNSTTLQSVGLEPSTRYTDGIGLQMWVEIYSLIGTTVRDLTVTYRNQNNDLKTTTVQIGGTGLREVGRFVQIPLASGDNGILQVTSCQFGTGTGTVGNFGIVLGRQIITIPLSVAAVGTVRDLVSGLPSIQKIENGACIAASYLASTTTHPIIYTSFHTVEK